MKDEEQIFSNRDQALSDRDQAASDRDQADQAGSERGTTVERQETTRLRAATSEERAAEAERTRVTEQLARGTAHDLRHIIGLVRNYTNLMVKGLPGKYRDNLEDDLCTIQGVLEQAEGLANQLSQYGKPSPGRPAPVNVCDSLRDTLAMIDGGIEIDLEQKGDIRPVLIDQAHIQQIVMNLTLNARDAMSKAGIVQIRLWSTDDATFFSVKDTGKGMDEETLQRIFDPFFSTKPRTVGTGLGLSLVKTLVEEAEGWITVDSRKGVGTTFNVCLPCVKEVH